jgi:large subunit ribosomal protein L22
VEKLLRSALANAQHKDPAVDVDRLVLKRAFVDAAPSLKRSRAAGMGRVFPVLKRACHVTIEIDMSKRAGSGAA